jgi:hypothetical protein
MLQLRFSRRIEKLEIENVSSIASIAIWKAVVHDRATQTSIPLSNDTALLSMVQDQTRWERPLSQNGVLILENLRSRGRAWLVNTVEASDSECAFQRVRGEADDFDPFKLALLEVSPGELPSLDSTVAPGEVKQLTYKPNALELVTESVGRALLVISQTNYPGWIATIDGHPTNLYTTDYVVQGVAVPAGRHVVELRYTAPEAKKGAIISVVTLILLVGIAVMSRRRARGSGAV